jgi:hypothetical protein
MHHGSWSFEGWIHMKSSSGWFTISYGWIAIRNKEIADHISKGGSAESVRREAKLFPVPIPIMAPIIQWAVFSLPIDESHPFSDITKLISRRKSMEQISSKPPDYFPVSLPCDLRQVGGFLRLHRVPSPIELTATIWLKYCWKWR